jgi:hypothetical protein
MWSQRRIGEMLHLRRLISENELVIHDGTLYFGQEGSAPSSTPETTYIRLRKSLGLVMYSGGKADSGFSRIQVVFWSF